MLIVLFVGCGKSDRRPSRDEQHGEQQASVQQVPTNQVTFHKDIAPLVWRNCSDCHRPGEAAPFSLITYDDVRKRAAQIVEVTNSRYMPPWLAETTEFPLEGDRRLSDVELDLFARWVLDGTPEGNHADRSEPPQWPSGWNLGEPDLVVQMSEEFVLPAEGPDVYRNFVIPVPITTPRYVRAMEFRPGNFRIVHHAFMLTDTTQSLRRLTEGDGQPGFEGMDTRGATAPDGHFIGWQPGRQPYEAPEGTAWRLTPGTDVVLQVHMQPTGKQESIRAAVGFSFTDQAPTKVPIKLILRSTEIDIPPGVDDYTIEDQFTLPVDTDVLAVAPHAHYLGKKMYAIATLPDGVQKNLLTIEDWDLNWQREYRYAQPVSLPRGTKLTQRFVYDNSSSNIRNPSDPPIRVRYGLEATDEMGSLWFQLLTKDPQDRSTLEVAMVRKGLQESYARHRRTLSANPTDTHANIELGKIAVIAKKYADALQLFRTATRSDPESPDAHYYLGQTLLRMGHSEQGRAALRRALSLDDRYFRAYHDLGYDDYLHGRLNQAQQEMQAALKINPYDSRTLQSMGRILLKAERFDEALPYLEQALESRPDNEQLKQQIDTAKSEIRRPKG